MQIRSTLQGGLAAAVLTAGLAACTVTHEAPAPALSLSPEPLIGKFVWHDLITDDIEGSRRFYGGLFGWSFEDSQRPGGGEYTLIRANGRYLGGILYLPDPGDGTEYSRWLAYLSVADVDRAVATNGDFGGEVLRPARQVGQVGRAAVISDPQGAVVGLLRSDRGDPDDSAPEAPGQIVWNELLAVDEAEAADFYGALAGYDVRRLARRGGEYYVLEAGQTPRAGVLENPLDGIQPAWLTYFAVSDPAAAAARVEALGGTVLLAPAPELREGTMTLVADPGGALLVLHQMIPGTRG